MQDYDTFTFTGSSYALSENPYGGSYDYGLILAVMTYSGDTCPDIDSTKTKSFTMYAQTTAAPEGTTHFASVKILQMVPEPATMVLMIGGGLALLRRRRK